MPALFSDLALILVTAGVTTVIFKWLKQPLVLGYIVAGFLIGPYFTYFPIINDHDSVHIWSDIGMVFLLFAIGLEFSFKKLKKVGSTVGITALTEIVVMILVGYLLGKCLGLSQMDCIFLGAMLSISSTTIIAKAFEDLKLKGEKYTENVIGVLVIEDLVAVLLMVLLSTISVSATFDGMELLFCVGKLLFFLLVWFFFGIFLIPSLLRLIRKFMNEETITVVAVGLCFLMVVLASSLGFSTALGAFIMGSILAETLEADIIHRLTQPIKNLFGAIFFVSVGMMVNPQILIDYIWPILIITCVIIFIKSSSVFLGMTISGHTIKTSIQTGTCFSQIGEFSFIIASLGISFNVIDEFLYPVIVSVSIITTFLTPYTMKAAIPLYNWLERVVPERWKDNFNEREEGFKIDDSKKITIRYFLSTQLKKIVVYTTIVIALMLLCFAFIDPLITPLIESVWGKIISCLITLTLVSPFLWAMSFKHHFTKTTNHLLSQTRFNRNIIRLIFVIRYFASLAIIMNILSHYFVEKNFWLIGGIAIVGMFILAFSGFVMRFYQKIEKRFLDNLNNRQNQDSFIIPDILQRKCRLETMVVGPNSQVVGKRLMDTVFRSQYNVNVVSIERGDTIVDLPSKEAVIYPYDRLTLLGEDEKLKLLRPIIVKDDTVLVREREDNDINVHRLLVTSDHPLCGRTLLKSMLREKFNAMVIAIQNDEHFNLSPNVDTVFHEGETVWFVSTTANATTIIEAKKE